MTTIEFSNEFDVLLDSYRRFKKFDEKEELDSLDFNEYEKSIFLTRAQEQIVIELYSGRNTKGDSFEGSEELRSSLRNLIKTAKPIRSSKTNISLNGNSVLFELPSDLLFITYEAATLGSDAGCHSGTIIEVIPVTHDDIHKITKNPFKGPNERRALRVDIGSSTVELISKYKINEYLIRYISKPTPIILDNFSEVKVDGENKITECALDSALHRDILERAVLLALASKRGTESK